ncbi:MAG: DMT family transporter [Asticcacaulis sp.]
MSTSASHKSALTAYLCLMTATLFWAGNMVAGKLAVGHISPAMLNTLRWTLAMGLIFSISYKEIKADWPVIKRYLPLLLAYGFVGFGVFNIILYTALVYTSTLNVVIEHAAMPLTIFLLNFALFRVRASWAQLAGFILTFAGVIVTASHGRIDNLAALELNIGDALMLLNVLIYAGYTISLRWKPDIHWKSMMAIPTIGAVAACLPYLLWVSRDTGLVWPDATGWTVVVYAAIFPSLVSQVCFVRGVGLIGANRAGLFINTIPLFGVILSVLILREPLHLFHFVALALVLAGIILAEWTRFTRPATAS